MKKFLSMIASLSILAASLAACGVLYGILKGWEPEKWIRFGWATGAMAAGSMNDYAEPADEKQVWAVYAGNARVQR